VALNFFFLLSAYVITGLLMRERQRKGKVNLGAFYYRRMLRIWPLYLTALVLSYLAGRMAWGCNPPAQYVADALFVGNWFAFPVNTPLPIWHLWSISVEEQFYLIIPVVAAFASPRILKLTCYAAILLGSLTLLFAPNGPGHDLWHNSFNQFIFFAVGVLLALRYPIGSLPHSSTAKRFSLAGASILGAFFVHLAVIRAFSSAAVPGWALLLIVLVRALGCSGFLVAVLGIERQPPTFFLAVSAMASTSTMSGSSNSSTGGRAGSRVRPCSPMPSRLL
jgi:peptidoglycan/LPS O-acetylase OafA/YrhL